MQYRKNMNWKKHVRVTFFNVMEICLEATEIKQRPRIITLIIQMRRDCAIDLHTYRMMIGGGSSTFGVHLRPR